MEKIYFETYAILINVGESILKLNPIISKKGFRFVKLKLTELESDFLGLLNLPRKYSAEIKIVLGNPQQLINKEFYNGITEKGYYNILAKDIGFVYLLKRTKKGYYEKNGQYISFAEKIVRFSETDEFLLNLIRKLRLLEGTYIDYACSFNKLVESNQIIVSHNRNIPSRHDEKIYEVRDEFKSHISKFLKKPYLHESCEIAIESYELSYGISNPKVKFMVLMMGLESLFNLGKDQIRHTLARHLAVLLSESKVDFQNNYKRFKKLYDIRSEIAHGAYRKRPNLEVIELHDLIRLAITKIDKLSLTKEQLFEYLNQKGYK